MNSIECSEGEGQFRYEEYRSAAVTSVVYALKEFAQTGGVDDGEPLVFHGGVDSDPYRQRRADEGTRLCLRPKHGGLAPQTVVIPLICLLAGLAIAVLGGIWGIIYYYAGGVHNEDRALPRASALAFLLCGVVAVAALVGVIS